MDEYISIISHPQWRCRYRGKDTTYKERYSKGATLYRLVLKKDSPYLQQQLITLAYEILSSSKDLDWIDSKLKEIEEEISKL